VKNLKFRVELRPSVVKEISRIDARYQPKLWTKIEALSDNPTPVDSIKVTDQEGIYRLRLGVYRIFYEIDFNRRIVFIAHVMHRQSSYKKK